MLEMIAWARYIVFEGDPNHLEQAKFDEIIEKKAE